MPNSPETLWFTARYPTLSRELRTKDVGIRMAAALADNEEPPARAYSAIWDTGATHTNVTTR